MEFNSDYFEGFTNGTYQSAKDISDNHKHLYNNLEKNQYDNIFKFYICRDEIIYPHMPYPMNGSYNKTLYEKMEKTRYVSPYVGSLYAYEYDDYAGDPAQTLSIRSIDDRDKVQAYLLPGSDLTLVAKFDMQRPA